MLGRSRLLQRLREKNRLVVFDVGAYGFSMSSAYNCRPRCKEVLIHEGKSYTIRRDRNWEDLVANQTIPDYLRE